MRSALIPLAALLLGSAAAAQAPAPAANVAASLKPGAKVYDPSGTEAATIDSVANGLVVVSTGTSKVSLPVASFAAGPNGPVVSVTRAQLDQAATQGAAQAAAAVKEKLTPGAALKSSAGTVLGQVKSVADPNVVVATDKGDVTVPISGISAGPGGLVIGMTDAEFAAAVAAVKPPA